MTTRITQRAATILTAAALTGCATSLDGHPQGDESVRRAAELASIMLTPAEVNDAMNASGMTVDATMSTMIDDPNMEPATCLAVGSVAQRQEYAGSNWSAVRVQSLHEPGENFAHLLHQAVVEFPTPNDATAFYIQSIDTWAACTGTYTPTGVVWSVGDSGETGGMLIASTSQRGAAWLCSRALTAASTAVVDILTCSSDAASAVTAHRIAAEIASRASDQ